MTANLTSFYAMFESTAAAIAFEDAVLTGADLPECAQAVIDGELPTWGYVDFLVEQARAAQA